MSILKIKINDKLGKKIAECELYHEDIGLFYTKNKSNIAGIYGEIEQTEQGFIDVIDIDIEDLNVLNK